MAGYSFIDGMSNNAVDAYNAGVKPLSKITITDLRAAGWAGTKKLAVALAKDGFWPSSEWHHSGGTWYNRVDFYDPALLVDAWSELDAAERTEKKAMVEKKPAQPEGRRVTGQYATFGGSRRRPRFLGHVDFTGTLVGDWIEIDGGGRKKAAGNNIIWSYADD
ncbi:hypothetical protein [Varunaivibrio sulfuroxidans]|uniref:Uncharacterized protein n=1 Tax=Varunaivibrio sulfuroxidans TaxID=1773489 RepID=A0A4V2UNM4_9PROT|nr:hypothetical protein [Varunaivibrio sulfuroxidans]TCS62601.1 hypothetical protein EDD55_105147 [Varunaivibrio sulfuroxidans]WES30730.1 hypothetical protein P3M64_14035 [Varunaivibrio sulfuroxidans]